MASQRPLIRRTYPPPLGVGCQQLKSNPHLLAHGMLIVTDMPNDERRAIKETEDRQRLKADLFISLCGVHASVLHHVGLRGQGGLSSKRCFASDSK